MAEPKRLKAGKAFERLVLSDFVNNSHDTQVENNRTIETSIGNGKYRKGRPDIMILDTGAVIAILEVKATNWNKIRPKNLKKNLWRHQNQLLREHLIKPVFYSPGQSLGNQGQSVVF